MTEPVRIAWLYPQELNLYGDTGNIAVLNRRLEWRNIATVTIGIKRGEAAELRNADLVYIGGGQDVEQIHVSADLLRWKLGILRDLMRAGVPMLAVCAGYQLFGRHYETSQGRIVPGLGLLPIITVARLPRLKGTVIGEANFSGRWHTLVGFENHAGRTTLDNGITPLGRLRTGAGNNGADKTEGIIRGNIVGTYLHGPVLSINPWLADGLLSMALARRGSVRLEPLHDEIERQAALDFARWR